MLLADFRAYLEAQEAVDRAFREPAGWDREAILNVAGMGLLSAERTVRDYASGIWDLKPSAPPAVAERAA
jgi:starch phosphorylase